MSLNSSPVSRNLHLKVTMLFLELEDLLTIMLAVCGAMLIGNFLFSDRYIFHIPMNYFLPLAILLVWSAGIDDLQVRQAARLPAGPAAVPRQATAVLRGTQESVIRSSYFREEEV